MADYLTTDTELASVANAIRTKGGTSSPLVYPSGFVSAINAIPTGGGGGTKCAKFELTAADTFTFVEGYMPTYSELFDDCFFCGLALSSSSEAVYISGVNGNLTMIFAFLNSQSAVPAGILDYNNGIITIGYVDTFEQGFLYAFIPGF